MRFDVRPLLRGHWKGLTDGRRSRYTPDRLSRAVLALSVALALLAFFRSWTLPSRPRC